MFMFTFHELHPEGGFILNVSYHLFIPVLQGNKITPPPQELLLEEISTKHDFLEAVR